MLLPNVLRDGILEATELGDEVRVIDVWTRAIIGYFNGAVAGVVPVTQPALQSAPSAAVRGALIGISAPGMGAVSIQNAMVALWAALAASPPLYFTGALAITPPPALPGLAAILLPLFLANTAANLPRPDACLAIATAIHGANLGGTATILLSSVPIL